MKREDILYAVFPSYGNKKANEILRKKLSSQDNSVALETPLGNAKNPEAITEEQLKEQYDSSLKQKDKFEDKAKATILCVTVSVSLMLGASGLLNSISSRLAIPIIHWVSYGLFLYAVYSMITAAVMDIKVLSSENTIYLIPADTADEDKRTAYNQYVGMNWAQNSIRNNYVYSAYECIRNALICLFIIMAVAILPSQAPSKSGNSQSASAVRNYSYNESTIVALGKHNAQEIRNIVEAAAASMSINDGQVYCVVDNANSLFIKFQANGNDFVILSIEDVSWKK